MSTQKALDYLFLVYEAIDILLLFQRNIGLRPLETLLHCLAL